MLDASPKDCIQARESISASLDEELPELELERLRAHLRGCAACFIWAEQVEAATLELRRTPLETPSLPVVLARGGRRRVAAPVALAAAAAASLLAAFGSQSALMGHEAGPSSGLARQLSLAADREFARQTRGLSYDLYAGLVAQHPGRGHFRPL